MPEKNPSSLSKSTNSSADLSGAPSAVPSRVECTPETIDQGLAKLVLSLIELLRQLLERQAIRRMEGGSLSDEQVEQMGESLMKLEAKICELSKHFGLTPADLNLDLGPLGHLVK
ncbi:MAG TPA: gas vesicle protein K [Candidatus Dormibacteraeota bacterium]|nr:gas vesicle protein K [Candidatus Dormibacteraeota bacterium]